MPFIETSDRTSLFYKDWGTGKPVLFLHGWCLGAKHVGVPGDAASPS